VQVVSHGMTATRTPRPDPPGDDYREHAYTRQPRDAGDVHTTRCCVRRRVRKPTRSPTAPCGPNAVALQNCTATKKRRLRAEAALAGAWMWAAVLTRRC